MKYFKFAQVSAETGVSWAIARPLSGPKMPDLPGLTNAIQLDQWSGDFFLGEVDDSATADPDNYIFELTAEEYAKELKDHIFHNINKRLERINDEENDFRKAVLGKYDSTASLAGIYKYEQAKAYIADNTVSAPDVEAEATVRGVDVATMANRIVTNHEAFRAKEAKIAGIRGMIQDRLESYTFNDADPAASYAAYIAPETVGTTTESRYNLDTGNYEDVPVDVIIPKLELDIATRYKHLG